MIDKGVLGWFLLNSTLSLGAEYGCKRAALDSNFVWLTIPLVAWGLICPFVWYKVYQTGIGVMSANTVFSAVALIFSAGLGLLVFNESLSPKTVISFMLAFCGITIQLI